MPAGKYSYAFSAEDLYLKVNKKLFKNVRKNKQWKNKQALGAFIFTECFHEILLDIINNNVTFVLPLRFGKYAELCMENISGEKFKEAYAKGAFNKIDFVKSEFSANRPAFRYKNREGILKSKPIYLDKELDDLIIDYTYQGKQYY